MTYAFTSMLSSSVNLTCFFFLCFTLPVNSQSTTAFDFIQLTSAAQWSARSTLQMELYKRPLTYRSVLGEKMRLPANSFILQGSASSDGLSNDVWSSSDAVTWDLISGMTGNGVGSALPLSSFQATSFGGFAVDKNNRIYRISGRLANSNLCTTDVWSTDNGLIWRQVTSEATSFVPGRDETVAIADGQSSIYLSSGRVCGAVTGNQYLNDLWRSTDQGKSWTLRCSAAPWLPRVAPLMLPLRSPVAGQDDNLLFFTGVSDNNGSPRDHNDVYLSTNNGLTFQLITYNAPFPSRNNANAEVSAAGIIVMTSGKTDRPSGVREYLNDVWISFSGGIDWHQLIEDASFGDRRQPATVLDAAGFLLVSGGYDTRSKFNDVYRSTVSFDDIKTLTSLTGFTVSACGAGLFCRPSDSGWSVNDTQQVTCDFERSCSATTSTSSDDYSFYIVAAIVVAACLAAFFYYRYSNKNNSSSNAQKVNVDSTLLLTSTA